MAVSSKISFLLFILTLLSSTQRIQARESQFFNKIPSNNLANENQPKEEDPLDKLEQEPNFIPENQNGGYGLYGHESGQLPPSTTTTTTTTPTNANTNLPFKNEPNYEFVPKYLPKNYNTEAYVTEAEGYHPAQETNTNNYYNAGINGDSQNPKQGYPATTTNAANEGDHYYQNYGGNSYNGQQQGLNEYNLGQKGYTTTSGGSTGKYSNYYNAAEKQGMSDTRFLENGKYFYDLSLEKNDRYPFDSTRRFGDQYRKYGGYNGNSNENTYDFNNSDGFENKGEQFQDIQDDEILP